MECGNYQQFINYVHLKSCCGLTTKEYKKKYPYAEMTSKEHRKKIGKSHKGRKHTEESKQNMSDAQIKSYKNGRVSGMKGKKHTEKTCKKIGNGNRGKNRSDESKLKMRLFRIKNVKNKNGYVYPNFNPEACEFFDWFNRTFGLNGQHGLNGGEFHIKELGYFVDYYEPNMNLIIEWDEKRHYDFDGNLKEKDVKRQQEIEEHLGYEIIRVKDGV